MKTVFVPRGLLLVLLSCVVNCQRCEVVGLDCALGSECWPDSGVIPAVASMGTCSPGSVVRDASGNCVCSGFTEPAPETCDGEDNDCDGVVDRGYLFFGANHPDNTCNLLGECERARQVCIDGRWECDPYLEPRPEVCDGLDNDCDGEVDNGLGSSYFYDGPPATDGVGECRPGVIRCEAGEERISASRTPSDEVCDGLDNDCDALIDEGQEDDPKAFVLVIDTSGSMIDDIDAVRLALCDLAVGAPSGSQYAVVEVSNGISPAYVQLLQDFADVVETCVTLEALTAAGIANEYMLEGMLIVGGLTWPPIEDHVVAVFTDEPMQHLAQGSYFEVQTECVEIPYEVAVFAQPFYLQEWDPIVQTCGGSMDPLLQDRYAFAQLLLERFFGDCR